MNNKEKHLIFFPSRFFSLFGASSTRKVSGPLYAWSLAAFTAIHAMSSPTGERASLPALECQYYSLHPHHFPQLSYLLVPHCQLQTEGS